MTKLTEFLKRHQLIAYFVLTYVFTWALLLTFQPLFLQGQMTVAPWISLGTFGPALVSIGLSAVLKPRPQQDTYKSAVIAFVVVWILASMIILMNLIVNENLDLSTPYVIFSVITGLLPAFVVSSAFSTIPGVRAHLRTYRKPRGSAGYYLLALVLFPAIWLLGNLLSGALGMDVPLSRYSVLGVKLLGMVIISFLYGIIYGGLTEESGWRGFALPRLQARFSPLASSLILGIIWAVWHAPGRFGGIEAKNLVDTLVEWVLIVLITVIFTWFYNRTKGSLLITTLAHPAMNTATSFLSGSLGALILLFVFMLFVIAVDRMWRRLPADHPAIYRESIHAA